LHDSHALRLLTNLQKKKMLKAGKPFKNQGKIAGMITEEQD
jgi:hypothetical protein